MPLLLSVELVRFLIHAFFCDRQFPCWRRYRIFASLGVLDFMLFPRDKSFVLREERNPLC